VIGADDAVVAQHLDVIFADGGIAIGVEVVAGRGMAFFGLC
jgi:hypothetical protein